MRLSAQIWVDAMNQSAGSDFSSAGDCRHGKAHHHRLKPAEVVAEDFTLASAGGDAVDENVGLGANGLFRGYGADSVHEEDFGDFVPVVVDTSASGPA